VLSRGEPSMVARGGVVLSGQGSAAMVSIWARKMGWMLTVEGAPRRRAWVEKNRWQGLG
jgi:hypothetical protein